MTKKTKKKLPLATSPRFNAVIALVLIALSVGLGYLWLRGSQAAGLGYVQVTLLDATNPSSPKPLANFPIYIKNNYGLSCGQGMSGVTNGNGNYVFLSCTEPHTVGLDPIAGVFYVLPNRAGWAVYGNFNQTAGFDAGGGSFATAAFYKTDGDKDGVYDIDDSCAAQAGPASNKGCPVPAPAPAPKPAPAPAPKKTTAATPKATTPSKSTAQAPTSNPSASSSSAPSTPSDTSAPNTPTGLTITSPISGRVVLEWTASTDDKGVTHYTVERSTDQSSWTKLNDNVTEPTYTDLDASFDQKQYYRVIAFDAAGNGSEPAIGETVTTKFEPNVNSDSDSEVASDDGVAGVLIPAGAIAGEATCAIIKNDEQVQLEKGAQQKAGPYQLECKGADGNSIDTFTKPIRYTITITKDDFKGMQPILYTLNGENWKKANGSYDAGKGVITYESSSPERLLVAGVKSSSGLIWIITIVAALLVLAGGAFWWLRMRGSGGSSPDYSQYMSTTSTPAVPVAPVAAPSPTNTPPASPEPEYTQPPGQHSIEVPGLQAPLEGHQAPHAHHSPLDRLDEMEQQGSQPPKPPQGA